MHPHNAMHPLKPRGVHCIKIRVISHKTADYSAVFNLHDINYRFSSKYDTIFAPYFVFLSGNVCR